MSRVHIPQVLRPAADGAKVVDVEAPTVGAVVDALVEQHPALGDRLRSPDGELHRFVNVYLNGEDVRYLDGLDTRVGPDDEVRLLPAIAGG
ncbi:MAG TPA: ubiquitin-like small modifier protein 1 [Candidatus Limnocylindrales bacterium]|nr:ubiquitin-like small modifier protein 1 [Candidatus Limnocylindrales bacterium]